VATRQCLFFGQNFVKFQLEKYDFDQIFMRKMTQICEILKEKNYKIPVGSQEYRRILLLFKNFHI